MSSSERREHVDRRAAPRGGRRITDVKTHDEAFVTPSQLAAYLGVDRRQVMKWITSGVLPAYRFDDRQWRIELCDAQAFIRRSRFKVLPMPPTPPEAQQ